MPTTLHICLDCGKTNEISDDFRGRFVCRMCGGRLHQRRVSTKTLKVDGIRRRMAKSDIPDNISMNPHSADGRRIAHDGPWSVGKVQTRDQEHLNPRSRRSAVSSKPRRFLSKRKDPVWAKSKRANRFDDTPAGRAARRKFYMLVAVGGFVLVRVYLQLM